MPYITTNKFAWAASAEQLPEKALRVKEKGKPFMDMRCGIMAIPAISLYAVRNDAELYAAIYNHGSAVVVGAGVLPDDQFIWSGSAADFMETWQGD